MKVEWEDHDMRPGTKCRRDMNCIIATDDSSPGRKIVALIVIETSRIMTIGTEQQVAEYMTKNDYLPGEK